MNQAKILLIDFHPLSGLGSMLQRILESSPSLSTQLKLEPVEVHDPDVRECECSRLILRFKPDLAFLVLSPPLLKQSDALFQSVNGEPLATPILVVVDAAETDEMLALLKLGATDFVTPPLKAIDVLPRVWRLLEQTRPSEVLTQRLKEKLGLQQLVGESPSFLTAIQKIPVVAKCDASVLISGETGTGKELCARAIHYLSPRARKPFIPINCGAIPVELVENELFGHEPGAFTGASTTRPGLIQEANGGTLFLDEIDSLPLLAQVKLLRFLQEKEYRPLGSTKMQQADVRVITATNLDLEQAVREEKLRQDLYYRLNVIPLWMPPLRERREDIPLLARYFLEKYTAEFNKPVVDLSLDALQALTLYDWPGNVRELEHVLERAVVLAEQEVIQKADISLPQAETATCHESFQAAKAKVITHFERTYIEGLLLTYQGNITQAAQAAQKNRRAFWQLMRKHRIDAQGFKTGAS